MEDINIEQQNLLQEIEKLEWDTKVMECLEKCEIYLQKYPNCKRVIPYYAHMYHFIDYVKATDMVKKLYDEQPHFYQNTYIYVYLLLGFKCRGRDDIKTINNACNTYKGDKDIYFYMTYAITEKQLGNHEQNIKILKQAVEIFPDDKLKGRVLHHLSATTGSKEVIYQSIKIQPNYDYNYLNLGVVIEVEDRNLALENFQKILDINPMNSSAFFYLAQFYRDGDNQEQAKNYFNQLLTRKIYYPYQIAIYLDWRVSYETFKDKDKREKISIDLIKNSYLFEFLNRENKQIFLIYSQYMSLFSEKEYLIDDARDLLSYYMQQNILGYLQITKNHKISELLQYLIKESNFNLQNILLLLAYNKNLRDQITFKQQYLVWDLYID